MIAKVAITTAGLFALGAGLIRLIHRVRHSDSTQMKDDWIKYGIFLGIVGLFLVSVFIGPTAFCCLLVGLIAAAGYEIWSNFKNRSRHSLLAASMFTTLIMVSLAHLLFFRKDEWPAWCAFFLLLVFVTDSYAQLIGRLTGRHHLCPRISPNKTVEGFLGSIVMAIASAVMFSFILPRISAVGIIAMGLITALSATAGDLVFSAVKRKIGIKDFSGFLPGHGGILDRFDSLIVAAPVFFWGRIIVDHLSGGAS